MRYRIYAVNSKSGKLATINDREISSSVTNTADGRTTRDATAQGDELSKPAAPTNLRAVAKVDDDQLGNPELLLYWTVPDGHPSAADLTKIDSDATPRHRGRAVDGLYRWVRSDTQR